MKEPVYAVYHIFVVYERAAVGGGHPSAHAFDKLGLPLQHPGNGFLHYLRGGFAFAGGEPFKLRLCIGCKMNFHAPRVRAAGTCVKRGCADWSSLHENFVGLGRLTRHGVKRLTNVNGHAAYPRAIP